MSAKANPTLIGVFVVGAALIAAGGFIVLGSGQFFKQANSYILYFEGDLSGLDEGAPVSFQGVRVGAVTDTSIVYDHKTDEITRPVVIKVVEDEFVQVNTEQAGSVGSSLQKHIERGLRAQLASQSLVTGKLKVSLAYYPDTEAVFRASDAELAEIPTIPAVFDSLFQRIDDLPLEEIVQDVHKATQGISALVDSGEIERTVAGLNETMQSIQTLLDAPELRSALASIDGTLSNVNEVVTSGELEGVFRSMEATLKESQALMREVQKASEPMRREVMVAMERLVDAARAAQLFLEYLERHPEALIHGKGSEGS